MYQIGFQISFCLSVLSLSLSLSVTLFPSLFHSTRPSISFCCWFCFTICMSSEPFICTFTITHLEWYETTVFSPSIKTCSFISNTLKHIYQTITNFQVAHHWCGSIKYDYAEFDIAHFSCRFDWTQAEHIFLLNSTFHKIRIWPSKNSVISSIICFPISISSIYWNTKVLDQKLKVKIEKKLSGGTYYHIYIYF